MSTYNTSSLAKEPRQLLFPDLLPFFEADSMDLRKQEYCAISTAAHTGDLSSVTYPVIASPYIKNELKGFIQHLALDCHYTASTIHHYIYGCVRTIAGFFNSVHPDVRSVTDIPYETIYAEYLEYLSDNGMALTSPVYHIIESMDIKKYNGKSHFVSGFTKFYKYIYSVAFPDTMKEYDKDIWDIRKLGITYNASVVRPRFTVNYTAIHQDWLKCAIKEYNYYRLQTRTFAAVLDDMKAFKQFSSFIEKEYPGLTGLTHIDRAVIEDFFAYLSRQGLGVTSYNRRISCLKTFFTVGSILDIKGLPDKPILFNKDFRKKPALMPRYFTDRELSQMNAHISELPSQIARMFFVLENCGMRVSDICSSTILVNGAPCLRDSKNGGMIFTYYMPKAHRYNSIPVSDLVADVIKDAIRESRYNFGDTCVYIFAKSHDAPISTETFSIRMNRMSKLNNLVKDDGSPLRIRGHVFRGTLATNYANCGISMDVIRMMLGQQKLGVLNHYVKIHSDSMADYLKPITEENEDLIQSIGRSVSEMIDVIKEPSLIPLPNGRCAKAVSSGICTHANACYSCRMFRPDPQFLDIYQAHLREAHSNIEIAKMSGYERILEINTSLAENLENIIRRLEI